MASGAHAPTISVVWPEGSELCGPSNENGIHGPATPGRVRPAAILTTRTSRNEINSCTAT